MKHLFWIFCLVWNAIFGEILFKNLGTCQAARQAAGMAPAKQDEEADRRPMSRAEYLVNFSIHERRLMTAKWSTCSWFIWFIWLVDWNINFIFPYIRKNHPNWLIFFRGVESTNWLFMDNGKMVHLRQHCSQDLGRALGEARKAAGAAQVRLVEFCQLLQVLRNSSGCDLCRFIIWYHMISSGLSENMAPGLSSFSPHLRMILDGLGYSFFQLCLNLSPSPGPLRWCAERGRSGWRFWGELVDDVGPQQRPIDSTEHPGRGLGCQWLSLNDSSEQYLYTCRLYLSEFSLL